MPLALGYSGVSSKVCKGFYKSLINAARCARWNAERRRFFMSGEDLDDPGGPRACSRIWRWSASLGLDHVERNGHHYVDGFAGAPDDETAALRRAPSGSLCAEQRRRVRLRIADGVIDHLAI